MLHVPVCAFQTPVVGVNGVIGVSMSPPNACSTQVDQLAGQVHFASKLDWTQQRCKGCSQ